MIFYRRIIGQFLLGSDLRLNSSRVVNLKNVIKIKVHSPVILTLIVPKLHKKYAKLSDMILPSQ